MKNIFKNSKTLNLGKILLTILFVMLSLILLSSTLKGELGNPTAKYIFNNLRGPGKPFENAPERNRYAQILSIAEYGTTTLPLEVAKTVTPDLGYFNGNYVGIYPPGFLLIALPFYLIGRVWGIAQLFTFSISLVFAAFSIPLLISIGKKLSIGLLPILISTFLFLFGTSTWAYTTTIYQHIITAVILLSMFRLLLSKRTILTSGLLWTLALFAFLLDSPNAFFVLPFILFMIFEKCRIDVNSKKINLVIPKIIIYGAFFCIPLFTGWIFYNLHTYGQPIKLSQAVISIRKFDKSNKPVFPKDNHENNVVSFFRYDKISRGVEALVTSKDRGLLLYSPFIVLSLFGLKSLFKKNKNIAAILLTTIGTIFVLYSAWGDPWGGWAFGPRYMIPLFGLSSIFLAQAIQTYRRNWLFIIVLIITSLYSIGINALGAVTTNQIPTYHEATGLHMKYNFLLNYDYLRNNLTGSFVYNSFFRKTITLYQYLLILVGIASFIFMTLLGTLILKRRVD